MALAGAKGLSTDEKLAAILNGPDDPDDEEAIMRQTRKAKDQLRRTSLYGKGAKFVIPKTKKKKMKMKSPFTTDEVNEVGNTNAERSAVPPGAHDEQYRIVQYQTKANLADPDRVWYATTSMREGLRNISQPPWYYGRQNKTKPADVNLLTAAARYGFRGSKEIRQFHTRPTEPADRTATAHTPAFLKKDIQIIDEWVPKLQGGVRTTTTSSEMFMSPKMWPKTSEFVNGYYYKEREVTSPQYVRQTTAGSRRRPRTTQNLEKTYRRRAAEDEELIERAKSETQLRKEDLDIFMATGDMEAFKSSMSLPLMAKASFNKEWNDTLETKATSLLKQTMKAEKLPFQAHKLQDETDTMRYSGSTAFIIRSQSTDELKFRLQMERIRESIPYTLRWRQVMAQYKYMKQRLKRDQNMPDAIRTIALKLKMEAKSLGQPTMLPRIQFIKTMGTISYFEHVQPKQLSLLYSVFDPMKKNYFRFIDFLIGFTLLENEKDDAVTKLSKVWKLNEEFGLDRSVMELALHCLTSAVASDAELAEIESEFASSFRSACYQNVILHKNVGNADEGGEKNYDSISGTAYNICDNFLNRNTFLETLKKKCSKLLEIYDKQLSARLTQYYGKDSRRIVSVIDDMTADTNVPTKDFSFLMS
jgi:hypothetical protein